MKMKYLLNLHESVNIGKSYGKCFALKHFKLTEINIKLLKIFNILKMFTFKFCLKFSLLN